MTNSPQTKAELMALIRRLLDLQQERAMDRVFLGATEKDRKEDDRLSAEIIVLRAKLLELSETLDRGDAKKTQGGDSPSMEKRPDQGRPRGS
jgi:hypothetical protein